MTKPKYKHTDRLIHRAWMDELTGDKQVAQRAFDTLDQDIAEGREEALKNLAGAMDRIYGPLPEGTK